MSTSRLIEIINRFNLYPDLRERWTTEEVIAKMREDIQLDTISVDTIDRRTGRPTAATIAFTLSYEGKSAGTVQKVANVLTSLFLEENLQVRERQATETSKFLEEEMSRVRRHMEDVDRQIAVFKEAHINELPEMMPVNLQALNNIDRNVERVEEQVRSLKEREGYLATQLAGISELENQVKMRIDVLKLELAGLTTRYSEKHPDVIKARAELTEIERTTGKNGSGSSPGGGLPENTAYITLAAQLASTRSEIESAQRQLEQLNEKEGDYRSRIEAGPKVEQEYSALALERDNNQVKYNDLMQKVMEARVAQGLETEQKGERFTLIDPPRIPEKPFKPNRLAIVLVGLVLGIGAGVGTGALKEFSDRSVRSPDALARMTALPVLGVIPEIITRRDIFKKRIRRFVVFISMVVVIAAAVAVFHYFVMDLDVFWAKVARKLDHIVLF